MRHLRFEVLAAVMIPTVGGYSTNVSKEHAATIFRAETVCSSEI
jgi:hypothetical protein